MKGQTKTETEIRGERRLDCAVSSRHPGLRFPNYFGFGFFCLFVFVFCWFCLVFVFWFGCFCFVLFCLFVFLFVGLFVCWFLICLNFFVCVLGGGVNRLGGRGIRTSLSVLGISSGAFTHTSLRRHDGTC